MTLHPKEVSELARKETLGKYLVDKFGGNLITELGSLTGKSLDIEISAVPSAPETTPITIEQQVTGFYEQNGFRIKCRDPSSTLFINNQEEKRKVTISYVLNEIHVSAVKFGSR